MQEISNEYWCFPGLNPEGSNEMTKESYVKLNRKLHLALVRWLSSEFFFCNVRTRISSTTYGDMPSAVCVRSLMQECPLCTCCNTFVTTQVTIKAFTCDNGKAAPSTKWD